MNASVRRTFTVGDGLLLTGATAVALALWRSLRGVRPAADIAPAFESSWSIGMFMELASSILTCWSIAIVIAAAWGPRGSFRTRARGPGLITCMSVLVSLVMNVTWFVFVLWGSGEYVLGDGHMYGLAIKAVVENWSPVVAIICAWLALALAGAWKGERSWIDRLGVAIGIGFVLHAAAMSYQVAFPSI